MSNKLTESQTCNNPEAIFTSLSTGESIIIDIDNLVTTPPARKITEIAQKGEKAPTNDLKEPQSPTEITTSKDLFNTFAVSGDLCKITIVYKTKDMKSVNDKPKSIFIEGVGFCSEVNKQEHNSGAGFKTVATFLFNSINWREEHEGKMKTILVKNEDELIIHDQSIRETLNHNLVAYANRKIQGLSI